jgi:hypothetical protein
MYPLASLVWPCDPPCPLGRPAFAVGRSHQPTTSDSSGFAGMIAPLSALSNGNSRSPRVKARQTRVRGVLKRYGAGNGETACRSKKSVLAIRGAPARRRAAPPRQRRGDANTINVLDSIRLPETLTYGKIRKSCVWTGADSDGRSAHISPL